MTQQNGTESLPMRFVFLLVFFLLVAPAWSIHLTRAIPANCRQVVLVTARDWAGAMGTAQRFEREGAESRWRPVGRPVEILLGKHGLGWGVGLHPPLQEDGPRKVEGDLRAPAGVFELGTAFGRAAREDLDWLRMPYRRLSPTTEAIDDPASRFYNRLVDRAQIRQPDWKSSERMWEIPAYELGMVIAHNPERVPRAGSCIFLHLWTEGSTGTAGCTALHRADLVELMRWLDPQKRPVLVQLPARIARESWSGF